MNKKQSSLKLSLLNIALVPMVVLALIITIAGSSFITFSLNKEVQRRMVNLSNSILVTMDLVYPGVFSAKEMGGELYLFKGEHAINGDFSLIDDMKNKTGCDITLFYRQYSVITTLTDSAGNRLIGAGDSERVVKEILEEGKNKFYENAYIGNENIYAYYSPLFGADNEIIGMIMISEPTANINSLVWKTIIPILSIALLACILIAVLVLRYTKAFSETIKKVQVYMNALANGDFGTELDQSISKRTDEIGQMGKSATKMSASLQKKVEEDLLTGLLNRRSAEKKISKTMSDYIYKGVDFCVALGDIDFFKKVNDTYGHEAGDMVLIAISKILKTFTKSHGGYAIRWGGEEFLLVFENSKLKAVMGYMNELLDEVRSLVVVSGENQICKTMTFGLVECNPEDMQKLSEELKEAKDNTAKEKLMKIRMDKYIDEADEKLYYGKEHGRNQLVVTIPAEEANT